jgi:hypothetical protein
MTNEALQHLERQHQAASLAASQLSAQLAERLKLTAVSTRSMQEDLHKLEEHRLEMEVAEVITSRWAELSEKGRVTSLHDMALGMLPEFARHPAKPDAFIKAFSQAVSQMRSLEPAPA